MTLDEMRAFIPPGYVECSLKTSSESRSGWRMHDVEHGVVCAMPIPDSVPIPRMVQVGEIVVEWDVYGRPMGLLPQAAILDALGGYPVRGTKWKLVHDGAYWEEVRK